MTRPVSWIAFHGIDRTEILRRTNLVDTGDSDEYNDADWSLGSLPSGWHVLWGNDLDAISPERLQHLSAGCRALACSIDADAMASSASLHEDGALAWHVSHNPSLDSVHLEMSGNPPDELAEIRERLVAAQESSGAGHADVDYIFDIPIELAKGLCGFDDDFEPEDMVVPFTRLALA
jgi:hypothetical protein